MYIKPTCSHTIRALVLLISLTSALVKPFPLKNYCNPHLAAGFFQGSIPLLWPLFPHIIQNYHRFQRETPKEVASQKRLFTVGFAIGALATSSFIARELWLLAIAPYSRQPAAPVPPNFLKA